MYGAGRSGVRFLIGERKASLRIPYRLWGSSLSSLMATGTLFSGEERPEREVNHWPPTSGAILLLPLYAFKA